MKETKIENTWLNDLSLCEVIIILPKKLKSEMQPKWFILEQPISITINECKPKDNYKYTHSVSGYSTSINITIKFDSITIYEELKKWYDITYNPQNGLVNYKSDCIGEVIINKHDRTGSLIRRFTLNASQLIGLNDDNKIIEANFIADYWLDEYIDTSPLKIKEVKDLGPQGFQGVQGTELMGASPIQNKGYHLVNIPKGEIGKISKIEEELNELKDADSQKSKIMIMIELSDLYGAIEEYCNTQNITMEDIKVFSNITKRAFKNGHRK